jgi:hypothetical protein
MEGGRQAEVAKAILGSLNVPYVVAAPLLIQDLASWSESGIQGLQVRAASLLAAVCILIWWFVNFKYFKSVKLLVKPTSCPAPSPKLAC